MSIHFVAALLVLVSHAHAQGWSITAIAPMQGMAHAFASFVTNSAVLPIGPVPPGTFLSAVAGSGVPPYASSSVALRWIPSVSGQSAPLAFTANCVGYSSSGFGGSGTGATGSATIDLTLWAPQPVAGRLWVRVAAQGSASPSSIWLDVMADGSIEVSAQAGAVSTPLDLPLQIPATGAVVRLSYACFTSGPYANENRTIEALFFPDEPVVAPFATTTGGATMAIDHGFNGTVTLSIGSATLTPVLMAFGGMPINVPLLPYVTVLVSPDIVIANVGSITLPLPPFPPGTAIYAQGLVIDSLATLRSTNSVRALWL